MNDSGSPMRLMIDGLDGRRAEQSAARLVYADYLDERGDAAAAAWADWQRWLAARRSAPARSEVESRYGNGFSRYALFWWHVGCEGLATVLYHVEPDVFGRLLAGAPSNHEFYPNYDDYRAYHASWQAEEDLMQAVACYKFSWASGVVS